MQGRTAVRPCRGARLSVATAVVALPWRLRFSWICPATAGTSSTSAGSRPSAATLARGHAPLCGLSGTARLQGPAQKVAQNVQRHCGLASKDRRQERPRRGPCAGAEGTDSAFLLPRRLPPGWLGQGWSANRRRRKGPGLGAEVLLLGDARGALRGFSVVLLGSLNVACHFEEVRAYGVHPMQR